MVAERMTNFIRKDEFEFEDGSSSVTASIGIADSRDIEGDSPDALVKAADIALYQAKSRGRDQVVVYNKESLPPPSADD